MSVSGKYLACTIDGVDFEDLMDWTVDEDSEAVERVTGSTGGFHDEDSGIQKAAITMNFVQDTTTGFYVAVRAGTVVENLRLWRNAGDTTPAFDFPLARVQRSGVKVQAKGGPVTVPLTLVNKRAYTANDPSTPA
jgi:hypothetical protein